MVKFRPLSIRLVMPAAGPEAIQLDGESTGPVLQLYELAEGSTTSDRLAESEGPVEPDRATEASNARAGVERSYSFVV